MSGLVDAAWRLQKKLATDAPAERFAYVMHPATWHDYVRAEGVRLAAVEAARPNLGRGLLGRDVVLDDTMPRGQVALRYELRGEVEP